MERNIVSREANVRSLLAKVELGEADAAFVYVTDARSSRRIRVIPLPPYRLEPLDILFVSAQNAFENFPIDGLYPIDLDGSIDLGPR